MKMLLAVNGVSGAAFAVRHVPTGERYGLNLSLVNEGPAMQEFYDTRYPHTELGQFVTRYRVDTLREHEGGLDLVGDVRAWRVTAEGMKALRKVIQTL